MKGLKGSLMSILVTGLCLLTFNSVRAQVSTLGFSTSVQSYSSLLITGTVVSSSSTDDDDNYTAQSIGFTFPYAGTNYTTVGISANGFITLGGATSNYNPTPCNSAANYISAMGLDLQGNGLSTSDIRIATIGTAPNRICVIQFRDWGKWSYTTYTSEVYNFQFRLSETTGQVQIVYGTFATNQTQYPQLGMSGATLSDFAIRTNTSTWAATSAATGTTATMTLSSTNLPDSGRTYTWANLPMVFNSVTSTQTIGNAATGTNNNPIIAAVANTTGNLSPKVVYGIDFTTTGSNNITSNVSAARVLYTGNTSTFSNGAVIRQFGSTITSPSGTLNFTSAGDTLRSGDNYYWLVYDVTSTATTGDTLDATCIGFTDSIFRVPTTTSPSGYKLISGAMSGVYTIGGSGARNYASFSTAIADLIAIGLAGPVTFNVAAGTYPQVIVPNNTIVNADATNTITFDGINPSTRTISTSTSNQGALILNGCKYYTFKNFTITNTVSAGATGVGIVGTATTNAGSNNAIKGCTILLPNVSSNTAYGICVSSSANGYGTGATAIDSITLDSNTVTGGGTNGVYYGYVIYGAQNATYNRGIVVRNNTLTLGYYMGFYMPYIFNPSKFHYNTVNMNPTYGYYGMYNYYHQNSSTTQSIEYIGNRVINFGGYGIYMYMNGSGGTATAPLKVYNNVVDNGTNSYAGYYGIYLYNTGYTEYYHNTTRMTYSAGSSSYSGLYYSGSANMWAKNNVFSIGPNAGPSVPAYFGTSPSTSFVNYNFYYNAANTTLLYRGGTFTSSNFKTTTAGGDSSTFTTVSPFVSNTDLRLTNGCFGKGVDLTSIVPLDLTRLTRNVPPDFGAYEFTGGAAGDLSVYQLVTPFAPIVTGAQDLIFRVRNLGNTTVTSFDANYTLNGGTAVSQTWSGTLLSCGTDSVIFTGGNQITLGASNAIKVYSSNPNFSTDPNRANDTISVLLTGPLNGAYTINPSAAVSTTNFQSFATAIAALSGGVAGPVTFTVSAGTYPQVTVAGVISGASAASPVTFVGANKITTIISTSTASQAALMLNATSYVTFKDFTVTNTYSGPASGAGICNGNMNTFKNLLVLLPNVSTNTAYGICVSGSAVGYGTTATSADSVTLDSNTVTGGGANGVYYGYVIYGNQNAANNRGIVVRGNVLTLGYYMGFYMPYIYNPSKFHYNTVNMNPTYGYYGMYNFYHQNTSTTSSIEYIGNVVNNFGGYGIYMYMNGSGGTATAPLRVYNNIINNGTNVGYGYYGIYLYNTGYTDFYNNTIRMTYASTSTTYCGLYNGGSSLGMFKNNIFMCTSTAGSTIPVYFQTSPATGNVNYNLYYNAANATLVNRGGTIYNSSNFKTATAGGDTSYTSTNLPFVSATNFNLANGCGGKGITNPNNLIDITGYTRNLPPDVGAYEFQGGLSNEISIDRLLSPVFPIAAGTNVVAARVRNTGVNAVSSFDLTYTVNGGTPVTTSWFGTLNSCDTVSVAFSTPFTVVAGTIYNLKVYTSNPNFTLDANRANDTISSQVVTPMNGTYTIGATASDFTTFNAAVAGLTSRGVDGPVTFNVRTGTYIETIDYPTAPGVSGVNTVIFQSMANNRDSVIIAPVTSSAQIWKFSGSSFTTLSKLTLRSTSTSSTQNGIVFTGASSFDTIIGCKLDMAVQTSYGNYSVYGTGLTSSCNGITFKNNNFNGSYYGIYMYGTSNASLATRYWNFTFDNNIVANSYAYGFYSWYSQGIRWTNNTFTTNANYSGQIHYYMYADSLTITGNKYNLLNNITMYLGYYSYNGNGITGRRGLVANNSFVGGGTGGSSIYLGYQSSNIDYINNTFNIYSTSQAAYIYNSGSTNLVFKNNIFSNRATGSAAYFAAIPTPTTALMNNNNYYTLGSSLTSGTGASANLNGWRTTCSCDKLSINYRPAVTSTTDNTPNPADTAVWAINGRGEFMAVNMVDINGVARPASILDGAPDLGAYNVNPGVSTLAPTATATPATPTAGTTQLFTLGSDTVASITWDAFTTPPASVAVRQYSGKKPLLIGSVTNFPYFYTSIEAPTGTYLYDAKINYRDNWMGTLYTTFGFTEDYMRLANKDVFTAWNTNSGSSVDTTSNNLSYTGFSDANMLFTGSDIFNPLPVKLTTFNGSLLNNDAKLAWTTASEINTNMFVLERSIDGKNFEAITKVKAAGNSSSLKSYNHLDKGIITLLNSAGTIYYRLKMVDNDNTFSYSKTIEIKTVENTKEKVSVTPNPFTTDLTITVETVNNANGTVEISDINGRTIISQNIEVVKGSSTITVNNVDKLKQGIYFVRYTTETSTQVFKMLKN
ncbi:MAG: T9SS type A sorting domain-containing protein [Bacteroidia bacterium]